ncbi:hypothetical protein PA08_0233 [Cutibacterium modestum P08]|nr:hypothetical protein PA08_0233 [Cutibacterium modestum P08]
MLPVGLAEPHVIPGEDVPGGQMLDVGHPHEGCRDLGVVQVETLDIHLVCHDPILSHVSLIDSLRSKGEQLSS